EGRVFATGVIGDGPHGSSGTGTGDFDFYRVEAAAGQLITVDVDTPVPIFGLDPFFIIYDSAGHALGFNDDDGMTFDSFGTMIAPATDPYFVALGGYPPVFSLDPFDPASGPGAGSEGDYSVTIRVWNNEADYYSFDLEAGDVLGAALWGGAYRLELYHPDG